MLFLLCASLVLMCRIASSDAIDEASYEKFACSLRQELDLSTQEYRLLDASIRNLLDKGASQDDLARIIAEFKREGVRRVDFYKDPFDGVYELIKRGQTKEEALAFFWQCVQTARSSGLTGNALVLKVSMDLQRKSAVMDRLRTEQKISNLRGASEGDKRFKKK